MELNAALYAALVKVYGFSSIKNPLFIVNVTDNRNAIMIDGMCKSLSAINGINAELLQPIRLRS